MFKIEISDGYCSYEYNLPISDESCIHGIAIKLFEAFGIEEQKGTLKKESKVINGVLHKMLKVKK